MPWQMFNNNPTGRTGIGDCAVRALSVALGIDWEQAYTELVTMGFMMGDMPSSNAVIAGVLRKHGFNRASLDDTCSDCYTAEDFCADHPQGVYVLGFGNLCLIDFRQTVDIVVVALDAEVLGQIDDLHMLRNRVLL